MEETRPLPEDGLVGRTLGPYRVLSRLGQGGMGEVYVAEDTKLERRVALKTLPPELADRAERRARFERESKAIAALNHPNIVTIHAIGETEGQLYIAMELIEGQTLSQIVPAAGLPLDRLLELAVPLVDAVAAAHRQGITHRDLKSDNVMLGADGRVRVLDFGLARRERPLEGFDPSGGTATASLTEDGRILGTVSYMSPEQSEGRPVDARSDIFSLGVMFYEMATGQRPFKGETSLSILASILKDTPRSVTELNSNLPSGFARIVRRCLHKEPERRYQSAVELLDELRRLKLEVETGLARAATPVWRRPVLYAGVAVFALVLLVAQQLRRPSADAPADAASVEGVGTDAAPPAPRFVRNPDGTWIDGESGLLWGAAKAAPQWKDAESWCAGYRGAGKQDWRLPTLTEVQSLCGTEAAGLTPPRHVWTLERRGKEAALYNCAENRIEAWWSSSEARKAKKTRGGIQPHALPVRQR